MRRSVQLVALVILAVLAASRVGSALAGGPVETTGADAVAAVPVNCIYTLATCPVSGNDVADGEDAIIRVIDGREVRFCCEMCVIKFEGAKDKYWAKIDAQIMDQQLPLYPLTHCVVEPDDSLSADGVDMGVNVVYGNRLARFCCEGCTKDFKKEPAKYLALIDAAAAEQQRKDYPLTTCVVGGGALGAMGDPVDVVVGGRLIRLCCKDCEAKLRASPAHYIAMVDQARAKAAKGN